MGGVYGGQVTSLKLQGSTDNVNWSDLAGTNAGPLADSDGNKMLVSEIYRPTFRYIRPVIVRGTANAVIDSVVADLHEPKVEPTVQDSSVSAVKQNISPPAGTA